MDKTEEQTSKKFVMSDALLRQRRNLIVTAVIAIMLRYGGVEISKVGALGTELAIANKSALYVALWLTLSYFILRYYQYLMYEVKDHLSSIYTAQYHSATHGVVSLYSRFIYVKKMLKEQDEKQKEQYKRIALAKLVDQNFDTGGEAVGRIYCRLTYQSKHFTNDEVLSLNISKWLKLIVHIVAVFGMIFTRPIFTDLAFPFVLAAIAIVYGWDGNWTGSILHTTYVLFN